MDRIGEYCVRRLIGEGGMGKVYEAEERLSRRKVALKVLRPELGRSEAGRQMFLSEMTILAHLDHPNIVRSLSCSEVDGQLVMALEFLEGETLRDRLLGRGRLPWPEAVAIAAQVASALGAAHGQSPPIVHRDLKPENVMIRADERVVVMDFGIAKVLQAIRQSTAHSVGTLQYMSPEQIDAAEIDPRADLYCLGLLLYECLAGHPPFQSESPRELLNMQCTAAPPPLPDEVRAELPRGVENLLRRLLDKRPTGRPASATEVLAALDPFAPTENAGRLSQGRPGSARSAIGVPGSGVPGSGVPGSEAAASGTMAAAVSGSGMMAAIAGAGPMAAVGAPAGAVRLDTVALLERVNRPREIPLRVSLAVIIGLSILAGAATYALRVRAAGAPGGAAPTPAATSASANAGSVERPGGSATAGSAGALGGGAGGAVPSR